VLIAGAVVSGAPCPVGSLSVAAPFNALAQGKPAVKVRYSEVVHSILYTG